MMAAAVDLVLADRFTARWRARAAEGTSGRVLEIGFGSGHNLAAYPAAVTEVLAVDPSDAAWERGQERIRAFGRPVRRAGTDAARLDLADASVDHVVSTWSLCTVPDVRSALDEARRVLRPGGALHLVEHGTAPGRATATVQRGLQPLWGPLAGGCHLDRDVRGLLEHAGFDTSGLRSRYAAPLPPARPWAWFTWGRAPLAS